MCFGFFRFGLSRGLDFPSQIYTKPPLIPTATNRESLSRPAHALTSEPLTISTMLSSRLCQDYCAVLFRMNTPTSMEAFKSLSEHMLTYKKENPLFLDNLGSYYLVNKDNKKARKYYEQVLKKHPDDLTALQNMVLLARATKDEKLKGKYQPLLARATQKQMDQAQ